MKNRTYLVLWAVIIVLGIFLYVSIHAEKSLEDKVDLLNQETQSNNQTASPITDCRYFASIYYAKSTKTKDFPLRPSNGTWHTSLLEKHVTFDMNGVPHFWGVFGYLDSTNSLNNVFLMRLEDSDGGDRGDTDYLVGWYYCLSPNDKVVIIINGDDITINRDTK